jgi:diaminopimelate epimerase
MVSFTKMNGAGNDFILLDNRDRSLRLAPSTIARICDRHRGIGADGVLVVEPATAGADCRMRYYNADGGEAEMCGNGARCFARYANRLAGRDGSIRFETMAGEIRAQFIGTDVRIQMSEPGDLRLNLALPVGGETVTAHYVNTGVPHTVVFASDLEKVPVQQLGSAIRYHPEFAPKGTNANFIARQDGRTIAIRTYERGVEAETLACGTGVVASALIFHETEGAEPPINVLVRGGERLLVGFEKQGSAYRNVTLTGPADFVFEGRVEL